MGADFDPNSTSRVKVDKDVRSIVVYALLLLVAAVGWFARGAFTELKASVDAASTEIRRVVETMNGHATQIALLDLRVKALEVEAASRKDKR